MLSRAVTSVKLQNCCVGPSTSSNFNWRIAAHTSSGRLYDDAVQRLRFVLVLLPAGSTLGLVPIFATSGSATTARIAGCTSNQLEVLASDWFGTAGAGAKTFDIVNRGPSCRIAGYPEVTFQNASAVAVDHRDVHQLSMLFAEPRVVTVTLARGGVATFGVSWNDNTVNNLPYNNQTCPKTSSALVVLRQGVGSLWGQVPIDPRPCGGGLLVTPIERGTWPRPNG